MRERVAGLLHRAGALGAVMRVRQFMPIPTVTIITYHHLADHDPTYLYDPDVADATPAQFRWQMETLARYCTPIGIDELIRAVDGEPLPKNPVMVTFDDGYLSCSDVALPILRAVGIRATFFVATSFTSERKLYWWERIALLATLAKKKQVTITYPRAIEIDATDVRVRHVLNDIVKDTPSLDLERFLGELAAALDVEWSPSIEADYANGLIMSWDQIRALSRAGMDVESHGRWHRVLQTLDDAGLEDELAGSKTDLETQLGRPVRAIAYPVGRRIKRGLHRIRDAIASAGYRIGLTNASGVNRMWPAPMSTMFPLDPFDVRRLSLDRSLSDAMYLTQIAVPGLSYYGRHEND